MPSPLCIQGPTRSELLYEKNHYTCISEVVTNCHANFSNLFLGASTLTKHRWGHTYVIRENSYFAAALGAISIRKTVLPGMAIPMLKIRRPNGRLIFNMEIAIRR